MLALRWFCEYTRPYFDLFWPKPVGSTRNTQLQEKQEQQEPQEQQEQQEQEEMQEQPELLEQLELLGHLRQLQREQQERQLLTERLELQEQEQRQLRQQERQQQLEHQQRQQERRQERQQEVLHEHQQRQQEQQELQEPQQRRFWSEVSMAEMKGEVRQALERWIWQTKWQKMKEKIPALRELEDSESEMCSRGDEADECHAAVGYPLRLLLHDDESIKLRWDNFLPFQRPCCLASDETALIPNLSQYRGYLVSGAHPQQALLPKGSLTRGG